MMRRPATMDPAPPPPPRTPRPPGPLGPALLILAVGAVLLAATPVENVNWDEFALLRRAADFARTGALQGGGRPGLAELALAPLVRGCEDVILTAWRARALWAAITLVGLAGLWALVREALRPGPAVAAPALAVALLAAVPVFPRWGLQVRTDQPAIALALWGGAFLLAGRRRPLAALAGGLLVGAGALFSQKAAYVAALDLVLFAFAWRREAEGRPAPGLAGAALRVALWAAGGAAAWLAYRHGLSRLVRLPAATTSLATGLDTFAHYRRTFGWRAYQAMVPTLVPHLALLGGLVAATAARWRAAADRQALSAAWAVLALGLAVGLFHAAAFPYFWLTLGLFPAVAGALALGPVLAALPGPRTRRLALGALALALGVDGVAGARSVLRDTQAPQREALAFVARAFPGGERGFQPEGALLCRPDPEPLPVYFTETILRRFGGAGGADHVAWLLGQHRARPVEFLAPSHVYGQFPAEVQAFWEAHYQPFAHGVRILGAPLSGPAGARLGVDLLAPGRYRFRARAAPGAPPRVAIAGATLAPGDVVTLPAGPVEVTLLDAVSDGMLQRAIDEAPAPEGPFYSHQAIGQITGRLTW